MSPLIPFVAVALLLTGQLPQMPAGMSHEEHLKQMQKDEALKKRGAEAMGFDQDATTHHFRLTATGGSIEVTVNDQADQATIAAIRAHLRSIAEEFAAGQFEKPFQTHGEVPPGVAELQTGREKIAYRYEERPGGGAVRIETKDRQALDAVHAFLRYQIREHQTAIRCSTDGSALPLEAAGNPGAPSPIAPTCEEVREILRHFCTRSDVAHCLLYILCVARTARRDLTERRASAIFGWHFNYDAAIASASVHGVHTSCKTVPSVESRAQV